MKTYDWIVVGGGITGATLAYELRKAGFGVLLLEEYQIPQNATRYSYGGLAYWAGNTPLTQQLCEDAIARYHILPQELDADIEFRELDLLLTISAGSNAEAIAKLYSNCAVVPRLLTPKAAGELEPLLNQQAISGALTVKHGHIHPQKTAQAYIQAFLRGGGEVQVNKVLQILENGVQTTNATYHSANIAICAGGLSRQLLKSAGISFKIYFTHAEIIETAPVDVRLRTLVMPANVQRYYLESQSTEFEQLWNEPGNEPIPAILDAGAIQFQDGSLRLGQISRVLTDPNAEVNSQASEQWLRESVAEILPALGNLPGTWHHCLVAFSNNQIPFMGAIPGFENIHVFSGFSNPLVIVPPLAERFAKFAAGKEDTII
ncbi:FAD-dependent oxidoreductase [Nostoc linckia z18]|uniref:FAD-dependent oxidoreductase n=2 Tax=Nostoc linckia TaxID=92942 RepID=A0A9Q5ZAM5_NOSLI|nr:FAD-binding oxidoreductase [Nostoc linckia]PHK33870.1 FAD-dependent oxidoreductase [Nostoc linckia z15]PHK43259.1 FAD-dependent oxidoreductase [Nostoc linckia z16]PHJ68222.1 FAD-dependent oxidoreductase [Nostoc linckia z1]PHJ73658.1 FAD-dependent oxidoreductase [Nostoc linckia z3]PHJ78226.1 FAD-dependent oxidoreductase [Nostoc linckia z2]